MQFATVLDGVPNAWDGYANNQSVQNSIEELVVLAPYEEDEELKPTHVSYSQYKYSGSVYYYVTINTPFFTSDNPINELEDRFGRMNSYRNVVAPLYFAFLNNLKTITVGEGMEYIGTSAFQSNCSNGIQSLLTRSDYNTKDPL